MISIRAVSKLILILGTVAFALNVYSSGGYGNIKNGFNLSNSIIPVGDIKRGGPARDGIPSIDSPEFISAAVALKKYGNDDRAIVVSHDGIKKVYPIAIMNWHELVNDQIAGTPILVTFCPLCGTGIVFKAAFSGNRLIFGVSGLLYQSDVLMFDRQTNSLWSQLLNKSVSGKNVGKSLDVFPSSHLLLKDYLLKNPKALVLSQKTGKKRDYKRRPLSGLPKI
ncbi:MAG: DUF3179 domain-containing protein [Halobacteriovoraceae bacterium]|nr:DUF3179 domain-containing protein [Halobacteriovoraceae bacterium]MBT5094851.1 DUF3179 domain-containing protein [Halobacteriovoraceae bacterium]